MDSSGFHLLVKNFTSLTDVERKEISELSKKYPYSQLLHFMSARAASDLKHQNKGALLNQSAVYSTDRSVLKWVMSTPRVDRIKEIPVAKDTKPKENGRRAETTVLEEVQKETIAIEKEPVVIKQGPVKQKPVKQDSAKQEPVKKEPAVFQSQVSGLGEASLSGDALLNDIYVELEKLKKSKHNFEVSYEEFEKSNQTGKESKLATQALQDQAPGRSTDPLIEEIKTTRKKLKADSPRQKEQNEIIDKFIKTQPVIHKIKPSEPVTDLSEDIGNFSDNVVSETLVDILIKQGKKDKAIEVLKKLIWKFPQKKAYFAAQIEGLKN